MLSADGARDALSFPLGPERSQIHADKIARRDIDGRLIGAVAGPAALQQRLVVACDEAFAANLEGGEVAFEESPRRIFAGCERGTADAEPVAGTASVATKFGVRLRLQDRAARSTKGSECGALIEGRPLRQSGERNRRQRQLGRRAGSMRQGKP